MYTLTILMVSSIPDNARLFRFDRRRDLFARRLLPAIQQGVVGFEMHAATSVEHLDPLVLRVLPDILHIVCHGTNEGGERALSFEDRRGRRTPVSPTRLRELLVERLQARRPGLLILEACDSRPLGEALVAAGVGSVIAMEGDADPEAGARFFGAFYSALAAGRPVREAFAAARRDLELLLPLAVDTPVLLGGAATIDARVAGLPRARPRGIARDAIDEHVARSAAHGPAETELRGRERDLARLIEATESERPGLVLLRGPAGVGKTSLVQLWLDAQHELGWYGYSRVFTWSFDSTCSGRGIGDIHAFLEEALFFFGDPDHGFDGKDPTREAYLRGLRLGRLVRDEPVLLVLDSVSMLPRGGGAVKAVALETLLHPALAALVREVAGGAARCVLVTRDGDDLVEVEGTVLELGGLDDTAGADLLWEEGMVDDAAALRGLSASLGDEPLALRLCARSFATVEAARRALTRHGRAGEARPLARTLAAIAAGMDEGSRDLLATLVLREGALSAEEPVESHPAPADDAGPDQAGSLLARLRPLVRAGIAWAERGTTVAELIHPALGDAMLELLDGHGSRHADLFARVLAGLTPATTLAEVHRLAGIATLARRVGDHARARAIYKDLICHAEATGQEQSLVARTLGAIAEDLTILAGFFAAGERGLRRWDTLVGGGDDEAAAFLFHRVALALRHLGRVDEAVLPMECACARYQRLRLSERAATCANDLAVLQVFRGDLDAALRAAEDGVIWSQTSGDPTTRFLTLATRGHVLHLGGDRVEARRDFEDAESPLQATDAPFLFSRPGHQYWMLLLDDIEGSWRAGQIPELGHVQKRFAAARKRHLDPKIAAVSRALDALAEGRLANLELEMGPPGAGDTSTSRRTAMSRLAFAVSTFRSHHHLWMLPQALCERARMRRLLQDPVNATLDLDEAQSLAEDLHLPLDLGACYLERGELCRTTGQAQEGMTLLSRAREVLKAHPCARLAERVGLVERALADAGADREGPVRER